MYFFTMPMNKPGRRSSSPRRRRGALVLAAGAAARTTGTNLSLVAYSTPKTVMGKIIQAWQQTPDGKGVSFSQSYGASTDQARAVAHGLKADIVFLSTGDDVNLLVDAGLVDPNWDQQGYNGIAADTVVVFAVRNGNPKHIKGWDDLVKPGVQVVTPNPFSSGSAKWNILAAYGAQRRLGKTDKQATAYVQKLFKHVVSQDTSGRNATNTFLSGKGDVLITYESEAINSRAERPGHPVRDPAPDDADRAADRGAQDELEQGQGEQVHPVREERRRRRICSRQYGFRPVDPKIAEEVRRQVPVAARASSRSTTRYIGGWRDGRQGLVRPEQRPDGQDRAGGRRADRWLAPRTPRRARRGGHRRAEREGRDGPLARLHRPPTCRSIVVLPIAALVWASRADGCRAFWDVGLERPRRSPR